MLKPLASVVPMACNCYCGLLLALYKFTYIARHRGLINGHYFIQTDSCRKIIKIATDSFKIIGIIFSEIRKYVHVIRNIFDNTLIFNCTMSQIQEIKTNWRH